MYPWYTVRLHGRGHGIHDHGHVRPLYTAVQEPCTWSAMSRVTAGTRWSCTRACLRPVSTAVARLNGHVRTVYTAVHGPCTWSVRVRGRSWHVRTVYNTTQCTPGIAKVDNRNLLDGYYSNPIGLIRSIEIDLFTFSVAVWDLDSRWPKKACIRWVHTGATKRIPLNRPCAWGGDAACVVKYFVKVCPLVVFKKEKWHSHIIKQQNQNGVFF